MSRIITLLSDFGLQDGYVGAMKGVILGINPQALLIDISHEIEAHDVTAGAFVLASTYSYFPHGTIHVAVVDPGVGSGRRAMIVETKRGYFVGPENGIFTLIYERETVIRAVSAENPKFVEPNPSRTFHGRDIFAPTAAYLSLGVSVEDFGPPVDSGQVLAFPSPRISDGMLEGQVIHVDRFGNLITNISVGVFEEFVGAGNQEIRLANHKVSGPYESYDEGRKGEVFGIFGSSDLLEISMKEKGARETLGLDRGTVVRVLRPVKGGGR